MGLHMPTMNHGLLVKGEPPPQKWRTPPPQWGDPPPTPPTPGLLNPPPLSHAQVSPGLVTLSWCGSPTGSGYREQTGKEGSGGQGELWLLKVA